MYIYLYMYIYIYIYIHKDDVSRNVCGYWYRRSTGFLGWFLFSPAWHGEPENMAVGDRALS